MTSAICDRHTYFSGSVLHAAEDDDAVARRLDLVAIELETAADPERGDLALDQPLARLPQRPLRLANAYRERTPLSLAGLDQQLAEEVRFARSSAAVNSLISSRFENRFKDLRCRDFQNGQWRDLFPAAQLLPLSNLSG